MTCNVSSSSDATVHTLNLTAEQSNTTPTLLDYLVTSPTADGERGTLPENREQPTSPEIEIFRTSRGHKTPPRSDEQYVEETPPVKEFTNGATSTGVRRLRSALKGIQTFSSLKRQAAAANNYRVSFDRFVTVAEYNVDKDRSFSSSDEGLSEQSSSSPTGSVSPRFGCSFEDQQQKDEGSSSEQEGSFEVNDLDHFSSEVEEEKVGRNLSQDSYGDEELRSTSSEVEQPTSSPEIREEREKGDSSSEVGSDCDKQEQRKIDRDFLSEVEELERTSCHSETETTEDVDESGEGTSPSTTELEPLSDGEESESEEGRELEEEPQLEQIEEIERRYCVSELVGCLDAQCNGHSNL